MKQILNIVEYNILTLFLNIPQTLVSPSAAGGGNLQWFDAFFQVREVERTIVSDFKTINFISLLKTH